MSTPADTASQQPRKHRPYVPETMEMKEFTLRAILLGLVLTVVLGAANAYLGLRAGITIAATYPAAVIAMAVLRAWKGSLLEENIALGGVVYMLGRFGLFAADQDFHFAVGSLGRSQVRLGPAGNTNIVAAGGASTFAAPSVSPAYLGVGYIIGLRLASIQFAGGVLAWGLIVPLLVFLMGPQLKNYLPADTPADWAGMAGALLPFFVRAPASGGRLVR